MLEDCIGYNAIESRVREGQRLSAGANERDFKTRLLQTFLCNHQPSKSDVDADELLITFCRDHQHGRCTTTQVKQTSSRLPVVAKLFPPVQRLLSAGHGPHQAPLELLRLTCRHLCGEPIVEVYGLGKVQPDRACSQLGAFQTVSFDINIRV